MTLITLKSVISFDCDQGFKILFIISWDAFNLRLSKNNQQIVVKKSYAKADIFDLCNYFYLSHIIYILESFHHISSQRI